MSKDNPVAAADDALWQTVRDEVAGEVQKEPILASYLHATILKHSNLEDALSFHLAGKLETLSLPSMLLREVFEESLGKSPELRLALRADIEATRERDPACRGYFEPLLFFKGLHALESYRVAHWLWGQGRVALALYLQNQISERFAVDIHPAAKLGSGLFIDHGPGVVIGETAVVEDDVSMLQEVTLGGTGKEKGDRHPKVRRGVLIGAGAKILGNVEIGEGAKVGAGSVVLDDVPAHSTVAGIPAVVVGKPGVDEPARVMDHRLRTNHEKGGGI
ncbi:MAG: serine O-acetyltransferase [Myxococcota bacterium]